MNDYVRYYYRRGKDLEDLHYKIVHVTDDKMCGARVKVVKVNDHPYGVEALIELTWNE